MSTKVEQLTCVNDLLGGDVLINEGNGTETVLVLANDRSNVYVMRVDYNTIRRVHETRLWNWELPDDHVVQHRGWTLYR